MSKNRSLFFIIGIAYLFCVSGLTVALKILEDFSWNEALWQVWQTYSTVGYGNEPAKSLPGRSLTMIFSFLAITLYAAMGGTLLEYLIKRKERYKLGLMDNPIKDGYIIFNMPDVHLMHIFIDEIRHTEGDVGICIVDNDDDELPASIRGRENIHFVKGSLLEQETYHRANLGENKVVIIFPANPFDPDSDAATKTIVDLTSHFVKDKETRIIHVLVKESNEWMFKDLPSIPVLSSIPILAMVQEAQDPYSAPAVHKLLSNTEGANPKSVLPTKTIGMTWKQFQECALQAGEKLNQKVNVFSLIRNGESFACPAYDTVIGEGDRILMIGHNDFNWITFEDSIFKCSRK